MIIDGRPLRPVVSKMEIILVLIRAEEEREEVTPLDIIIVISPVAKLILLLSRGFCCSRSALQKPVKCWLVLSGHFVLFSTYYREITTGVTPFFFRF
jgi:hypothetical protein